MKTEEFALQEIERQNGISSAGTVDKKSGNIFMISSEAPVLMTKASELFIREISTRAWKHTDLHRRKTIQRADIWASVGESEVYDFLIDIIPRVVSSTNAAATVNNTVGTTPVANATFPPTYATIANNTSNAANPTMMYNTNIAIPHNNDMMIVQPVAAEGVNVTNRPIADPQSYPTMGVEFAQQAFNFDNVSFMPMSQQQTAQALDENGEHPIHYHQPSQQWTVGGNTEL